MTAAQEIEEIIQVLSVCQDPQQINELEQRLAELGESHE
jgi:hypothetical protein